MIVDLLASLNYVSDEVLKILRMHHPENFRVKVDCYSDDIICLNQKLIYDGYEVQIISKSESLLAVSEHHAVALFNFSNHPLIFRWTTPCLAFLFAFLLVKPLKASSRGRVMIKTT